MNRCFEKPAVTHKIIEILGNNFSYEEIIVIGQRNEDDFHIHIADNHYGRLRLQPHIAAEYLATISVTRDGWRIWFGFCSTSTAAL